MRIAQVVSLCESIPPHSRNGLEFVVSWLTEELVKRGHEVTLFTTADSKTSARKVSLLPKSINDFHQIHWEQPFFSIWNTIIAGTKAHDFDIIHCHNDNGSLIAPFVDIPIIETIHHPYNDDLRLKYLTNSEYRKCIKPIMEEYKKVHYVTVSEKQRKFFKICEPYYFKKHSTIHNGIPVKKFSFNPKPKDYLLFIGYINEEKGADIAIQVARKAGKKLIIAGHNRGTELFFKEKIKPFLNDDIKYIGPVDFAQKNELYRNALATLAPLRWHEPFGLTLIESQACGTPVIAFDRGATREVINHKKTGFIVKNEKEMVAAIKLIHKINRKDCRDWVEKNFSVEKMTDEYEKLYSTIKR